MNAMTNGLSHLSDDDPIKFLVKLFTPILLATQNGRLADPETCDHRLRLGLNDHHAVCCACRTVIEGPCKYGIYVSEATAPALMESK